MPFRKLSPKKSRSLIAAFRISFVAFALLPLLVYLYFSINYISPDTIMVPQEQFIAISIILGITWLVLFLMLQGMLNRLSELNSSLKKVLFDKIDAGTITQFTHDQGEVAELARSFEEIMARLEGNIEELERTKKNLQGILVRVGKALSSADNFDLLMALILETVVDALGAQKALVLGLTQSGELSCRAAFGYTDDEIATAIGALRSENTKAVLLKKDNLCSIVRIPLSFRDKQLGVMVVTSKEKRVFDDDDLNIISSLGSQMAIAFENASLNQDMEKTYFETVAALAMAVEAKDAYSYGHSQRVGQYAFAIGRAMHFSEKDLDIIANAARLHDVGKIGVSDVVLNKPGSLSPEELEIVRRHPVIGENIVKPLKNFSMLLEPIRHHHEFLDGSGYPDGLRGGQISMITRILTVADIFDAISSKRVYRGPMDMAACRSTLQEMVDTGKLDGSVVNSLFGLIDKGEIVVGK